MADPMSPEQLAAIRARLDATTDGPWTVRDLYVIAPGDVHIGDFEWLADTDGQWEEFKANVAFAAAARQDVPALLDETERLRTELAKRPKSRLGEQVNRLSNTVGDLERERDEARAEAEQLRGLLGDARVQCESAQARAEELLSQRDALRAELAAARLDAPEASE